MAVATDREYGLVIGEEDVDRVRLASDPVTRVTLELYLETKSVIVNTGSRPINPFGL